jgi:hypothetical protein
MSQFAEIIPDTPPSVFFYINCWLVWLKRDPRWTEFRSDVKFQNLVRKIGLPS